jgi:hypothetical protein
MSNVKPFLLVIVGCLLFVAAFRMASFFDFSPVLPGILAVTFLRDAVIFPLIGLFGVSLVAVGIIDVSHKRSRAV